MIEIHGIGMHLLDDFYFNFKYIIWVLEENQSFISTHVVSSFFANISYLLPSFPSLNIFGHVYVLVDLKHDL